MVNYFFVDGARQQQGPVTAETMKQHLKGGLVAGQTLCFADDGSSAGDASMECPTNRPIAPIGLT